MGWTRYGGYTPDNVPAGYTAFTMPASNSGYDNKDQIRQFLTTQGNGVLDSSGNPYTTPIGTGQADDPIYGSTFYVPNEKYSQMQQPFDTNPSKDSGLGGLLGILAVAAAIYTGGASLGLWGGAAEAGAAAAAGSVSEYAVTTGMVTAADLGTSGVAAAASSALAGGATFSSVASTLGAAGVAAEAIPEIIVSAASGAGMAGLTAAEVTAGIAGGATLASVMGGSTGLSPNGTFGQNPDGSFSYTGKDTMSTLADSSGATGTGLSLNGSAMGPLGGGAIGTGLGSGATVLDNLTKLGGPLSTAALTGGTSGSGLSDLLSGNASAKTYADLGTGLFSALNAGNQASNAKDIADKVLAADPYRDYIKNSVVPFMQGQQDVSKNQNNQSNFYQDQYKTTYTDPLSIYNSPEMQGISNVFNNQITRRDAAAGRNSQYGARAVEEQNNFLTNTLPTYRSGLATMYNDTSTNAINNARTAIPGSTGTATVDQYGNLAQNANNLSSTQYSGLISALGSIFK